MIYLPWNVDINNGPLGGTVPDKFEAYHLQSMALTVDGPKLDLPPFSVEWKSYPYAVIPLKCATRGGAIDVDKLTELMSHEIVEAETDPISLGGWVDNSTFNFSGDFLKEGEAADICESIGSAPDTRERRLENGITVSTYWSNGDNACVPLLRKLKLDASGLPSGVTGQVKVTSRSLFNDSAEHTFDLPKELRRRRRRPRGVEVRHADRRRRRDPVRHLQPRWVDADHGRHDVDGRVPHGVPADCEHVAGRREPALADLEPVGRSRKDGDGHDRRLRPVWRRPIRIHPLERRRLRQLREHQRFHERAEDGDRELHAPARDHVEPNGDSGGVPWTVNVDGIDHPGPYSAWFDEFHLVHFAFEDPVPALTAGTRYTFVSSTDSSPLFVLATGPVTATYKTQHLLTVHTSGLPGPNLTTITNGGTSLGTANDSTPLAVWVDDGTVLALAGDADVNGVDGIQYFAQAFAPVPPTTFIAPFETTLTYKTMTQLIQEALGGGGLSGPNAAGVGKALIKHFDAVQASMGAHRYESAVGELKAFADLIQAQCCSPKPGKAIDAPTAKTLQLDAMLVYHAALCLGGGDLSAEQMANDYAYYSNLVASLGGTVLPPCA